MAWLDDFVPANLPLRVIRTMVNKTLAQMGALFDSIRSERQLMERTQYNLLFRWFIGLSMDDAVWVPTVFTKNRERLIGQPAALHGPHADGEPHWADRQRHGHTSRWPR